MSDIYWQVEGYQEAQKKQTKRLIAKVERLQTKLAATEKVVEAAVVAVNGTEEITIFKTWPGFEQLRFALRAYDAAKGGDDDSIL